MKKVFILLFVVMFSLSSCVERKQTQVEPEYIPEPIESFYLAYEYIYDGNLWWLYISAIDQETMLERFDNWTGFITPFTNTQTLGRMSGELAMSMRMFAYQEGTLDDMLFELYYEQTKELAGTFKYFYEGGHYFCEYWEILYATLEDIENHFTYNATTFDSIRRDFDGLIATVFAKSNERYIEIED